MSRIAIIDYGAGNVQSVKFAFRRLGVEPLLSCNADEINSADKVVFPGVGEASSAMQQIRSCGLDVLIPQLKQPVLAVCLGMQLLCSYSEEGETKGLGVFNDKVVRFKDKPKVPHMGWNQIKNCRSPLLEGLEGEHMYFVHSYYVANSDLAIARCDYMGDFTAAMQRNNFYACQFHPEKSGKSGEQILKNFLSL